MTVLVMGMGKIWFFRDMGYFSVGLLWGGNIIALASPDPYASKKIKKVTNIYHAFLGIKLISV